MRVEIKDGNTIHTLSINPHSGAVCVDGVLVKLSSKEYLLLDVLGSCEGSVVSSEFICMCLYHTLNPPACLKAVAYRLRKKLSNASGCRNYVFGFRNAGYMLA